MGEGLGLGDGQAALAALGAHLDGDELGLGRSGRHVHGRGRGGMLQPLDARGSGRVRRLDGGAFFKQLKTERQTCSRKAADSRPALHAPLRPGWLPGVEGGGNVGAH